MSSCSSSTHDDVVEATRTVQPPRATEASASPVSSFNSESNDASLFAASPVDVFHDAILDAATRFQSSASADDSSASHTAGFAIVSSAPPRPDSERATSATTAPVTNAFSSSSVSSRDSSSSTAAIPVDVFQSVSSYSAGTVEPNDERTAVESTALELSTSSEQVQDATMTTSTSTAISTTSTAPSSGTRITSTDRQEEEGDDDADIPSLATSDSARGPIFYGCVVLGVAGLVGAGFAFRAKRQRSSKAEWVIATEAFVETPPMSRRPPISQVRVVIDDHNFAIL
jgi:hypothetical protein